MKTKEKAQVGALPCLECGAHLRTERRPYRYRFEGGLSVTLGERDSDGCPVAAPRA